MKEIDKGTIDYKTELLRKSIHLCSLSIPIVYYFITRELALTILIPLSLLSLILDLARYFIKPFSSFFYKVFGFMLRKHEMDKKKKNLNGATYVLLASSAVILFFPKVFVIPSIAVLIIGDISAALIGRKFGKHKFLSKSLEGTLAFVITGSIVVMFTPKIEGNILEYAGAVAAVIVGAIAENISYGWADDNFSIPVAMCLTFMVFYMLLLPDMPLILPNVPQ